MSAKKTLCVPGVWHYLTDVKFYAKDTQWKETREWQNDKEMRKKEKTELGRPKERTKEKNTEKR